MANIAEPCACVSYTNLCCCEPINGITVVQPSCQTLPDGSVVNNPAYVPLLTRSFWSYKFITDCSSNTRAISNFVIPICELILASNVIVSEKIDGCGDFEPVEFTLTMDDPNYGIPPEGYQYLKVEVDDRYEKGVSVEYRIEIVGDFPIGNEAISVKASNNIYEFSCDDECYFVPRCNPQGRLSVIKNCSYTIENNQATLSYRIHVDNIGQAPLTNVQFQDNIFLSTLLGLGAIVISPSTLVVNTTTPGTINISGNLGTIDSGGEVVITYTIPIVSITEPGQYLINNTAIASATNTLDTDSCNLTLNVVRLAATKCCSIENGTGAFTLTISSVGASPNTVVDIFDRMEVPSGITIRFLELSGCEGYFAGTTNPIPINTNITGPISLDFICRNALVPAGSSYVKVGRYQLVSSSIIGTTTISNSITNVVPVNPSSQVLLGIDGLPATANINVQLTQVCQNQCL